MTPEQLREKIRVAAMRFTQEVGMIFGEAFTSVAAEFQSLPQETKAPKKPRAQAAVPAPTRVGRPPAATKAKAVPEKRYRRSMNELDRICNDITKLLARKQQRLRVEEINKELGTTTRELMRPIQKLLQQGKIKKFGERRATVYYV